MSLEKEVVEAIKERIGGKKPDGEHNSRNTLYCSFCGKSQHDVRKLIAGPTVFICNECVDLCADIIKEETAPKLPAQEKPLNDCQHENLSFASGDYYLQCAGCGIAWSMVSPNQPEYGLNRQGQEVGAAPRLANRGFIKYADARNTRVNPGRH